MYSLSLWIIISAIIVGVTTEKDILDRLLKALENEESRNTHSHRTRLLYSRKSLNDTVCGVNKFNNNNLKRSTDKRSTDIKDLLKRLLRNEEHLTTRIKGGTDAKPGQFPWTVLLSNNDVKTQCGGSLINKQWVLTAAHCLIGDNGPSKPSDVTLYLGEHNQHIKDSEIIIMAEKVVVYPDYDNNDDSGQHDIALVKMVSAVDYNDLIRPICFPTSEFAPGTECYASGWGSDSTGDMPSILKAVKLQILSESDCDIFRPGILCTRKADDVDVGDACQGDSGGPLACEKDGVFVLAGATSFGDDCTKDYDDPSPGFFADVFFYKAWVESVIGEDF